MSKKKKAPKYEVGTILVSDLGRLRVVECTKNGEHFDVRVVDAETGKGRFDEAGDLANTADLENANWVKE